MNEGQNSRINRDKQRSYLLWPLIFESAERELFDGHQSQDMYQRSESSVICEHTETLDKIRIGGRPVTFCLVVFFATMYNLRGWIDPITLSWSRDILVETSKKLSPNAMGFREDLDHAVCYEGLHLFSCQNSRNRNTMWTQFATLLSF